MNAPNTNAQLHAENDRLRLRLEESEATVDAIRKGLVDAVVVSASSESVYTLEGADRPYRLLIEEMQQGVALLNLEGVLLYCNPKLADLFEISVDKVIGCTLHDFVAQTDGVAWTQILQNISSTASQVEFQLHRPNGTSFPASLGLSVLPLQRLCLLVNDLSEQKMHEELVVSRAALQISEIRYRRLFETAKDGVLILDTATGKITDANPFMSELLGYSHEHFLDKELWEIGLFSDKAANEAAVKQLQQTGYIRYEHLPLETSGQLRVEVEVVANAYQENLHSVIQCNIRDITERSRLEKLLATQALALAELDRRKDEFLAMLGHELRNPLAAITNAVHLLSLQKNEGEHQHLARSIIERQVGQLIRLIDDLLEVSRISTGRIHLQLERIDLNEIVEKAVETARPMIDQHLHQLAVMLPRQPIWLNGDAARLEQVVVNLLNNAAKYTADRGLIVVSLRLDGDQAVLSVRDTGAGIAPELLPFIFDLFTQAERSLDRSQGGLGIGLCLVRRLVERHQGKLDATSILGKGSEFVVRLPALPTQSQPSLPPQPKIEEPLKPMGPSLRVLVVDDNADSAKSFSLLLKASGHDVRTVYDGPSAVQAALDFHPEVVLLDLGLPGFDGFEVAKRLRDLPQPGNVMLIAMTGYGQESDLKRSHDSGFDHHLVKPVNFKKVLKLLATVVPKTT